MTIDEIKKYMKENKITYDDLSEKAKIPIGTLKSIFSGRTPNPRIDTMQAIEKALGLNQEPREKLKQIPVAMYDGLDGLTDEQVQDVLKYIEFIKSKDKEGK